MLELIKNCEISIIFISPQSRAEICRSFNITPREVMARLQKMFQSLGNSTILDMQFFIDLQQAIHFEEVKFQSDKPVIVSECPGWICYVEKVVKDPIIQFCSRVKTPQMLASEIMKNLLSESGYVVL